MKDEGRRNWVWIGFEFGLDWVCFVDFGGGIGLDWV